MGRGEGGGGKGRGKRVLGLCVLSAVVSKLYGEGGGGAKVKELGVSTSCVLCTNALQVVHIHSLHKTAKLHAAHVHSVQRIPQLE